MERFLPITDSTLHSIYEKVQADERLSFEDGVRLYESPISTALAISPTSCGSSRTGI